MTGLCRCCQKPLSRQRGGHPAPRYCRPCNARHKWTEESRQKLSEYAKARHAREKSDPVAVAAKVASGKRLSSLYAKSRDAAIPEGYEEMNQILKRKRFNEAERKQMIADDIAAKERARLSSMTSFERALERVQNGAQLVAVPRFTKAEHALTLGGVVGEL